MDERAAQKKKEWDKLQELAKVNPELFELKTHIDDAPTLKSVGIELPHKDHYPLGYLKLWPQDFIVEEISPEGIVYNVSYENVLTEQTTVNPEDLTIYATLVKCGVSTIEVVRDICAMIGCTAENIQYAGIKDKDAITAQRISFRNVSFENIKKIKSTHFFLKDVVSGKGVIQKSSLKGNRFTILIRTAPEFTNPETFQLFADQLGNVKVDGFYNFYYLQRFGTPRLNNYLWAIEILKGNYEQAVKDVIASTTDRETGFFRKLRQDLAAHFGDWKYIKDALAPYPLMFPSETKLVEHLEKNPQDFLGALKTIPEQIQLWIYALSSYLFNKKLSDAALANKLLPHELPLFLSRNAFDWKHYEGELQKLGIFPPPFENLKPFPFIQLRTRMVATREPVDIHHAELTPQGLAISFSLNKGDYATTFLSHMFNLVSGKPPAYISPDVVKTKELLNEGSLDQTLEYFKDSISSKFQTLGDSNSSESSE